MIGDQAAGTFTILMIVLKFRDEISLIHRPPPVKATWCFKRTLSASEPNLFLHQIDPNWFFCEFPSLTPTQTHTHTHTQHSMEIFWLEKSPAAALYPQWHIDMSHGYMKQCPQTEADIPPPLWDKHLTNERSCTITGRLWVCPRWWSPPSQRRGGGGVTKSDPLRTCTPTNTHTLLMDEKWKDINRYTDRKGQTIHEQTPLSTTSPLSLPLSLLLHEKREHHSLVALKCQDKGGAGGAGSLFVYLQTGTGSGSFSEWKKTETHLQTPNTDP